MASIRDIVTFAETPAPDGVSPWVAGAEPPQHVDIAPWSPAWPETFRGLSARIREALGWRALEIHHVGSTSVPGLAAKPIVDIDLIVADPDDEDAYVPPLEDAGFALRIREPWWQRHRMLRGEEPMCNVHVFGWDSPEPIRHRLFRGWLAGEADDRALYEQTKRDAARHANAGPGLVSEYNARKQRVIHEIYARAFAAMGLTSR